MIAQTVRVSPEWLVLREPADAAARSVELAERLAGHLPAGPLAIHDLGGGTGAMGRWLAPCLPGPQHWVVHDRDADLLALAVADAPRPASVTVEPRRSDVTRLSSGDLAGASLIVASALLDLLTREELNRMLGACTGLPMLLALTVVGRVALTPAEPLDAPIAADVGGVTEALGHGEDGTRPGLLVPPGDPAALGAALRAWLGDAELRGRLRRTARERRASLCGWPATTSAVAGVLAAAAR